MGEFFCVKKVTSEDSDAGILMLMTSMTKRLLRNLGKHMVLVALMLVMN